MTQRINFFQIFRTDNQGAIVPLRVVRIGGVQLGPGVRFGTGVSIGGVDLSQYVGRDLQTEEKDGVLIITGIY